jgi:hypothetical protein
MAEAEAMQIRPETPTRREIGQNLIGFADMSTETGPYEIHSEARGPHWIAWISRAGGQKPDRSIVIVAETQEAAEARARRFAEQRTY